ncbi:MAG: UbiA family prenyltransferase [Phycisphaerae bacterium]|nr:UbiA family prenyltransferase [Phycisphaerae bacterium]
MYKLAKQYATLTRISNLPTCWTNVLTGCAIGSIAASEPVAILPVVVLSIIISLFYMAGMALNDLVDVKIDKEQRPDRPIASGRISPRAALLSIIMLFATALVLLLVYFRHCIYLALLLAAMIVLYDITHKRFSYSVVFMAWCRALIYIISACAVFGAGTREFSTDIAIASAVLGLYIALVTLIARSENRQQLDKRRWLSIAIILLVPAVFALSLPTTVYPCIIALALLIILSRAALLAFAEPPRIKQAVLTWLACICLLDCLLLAVLASPVSAVIAGLCFAVVTLSHRKIGGT